MEKITHLLLLFLIVISCKKEENLHFEQQPFVTEITNNLGRKWSFQYDNQNRVEKLKFSLDLGS